MPIWNMIQSGFASAQACQDKAYLIESEEVIGEYKNWMLNGQQSKNTGVNVGIVT
jgi:hypothetical protein